MPRQPRKYGEVESLSLTAMMDVMTIILVFLIKQVDAEGQLLTAADNLTLPNSTSTKVPKEVSLGLVVDQNWVLVDGQQVVRTDSVASQDNLLVDALDAVLKEKRDQEKQAMLARGESDEGGGNVIVQLDKNTYYDIMFKVMATCGYSGFTNVAFAVNMIGGEEF
ncbi:MAG: biopolymer transporter ExbD [Fibromonadaceae bacterium]|jgi:biopolymer transport protein ExbD|nr:biopolymer transporter ExbD [Fibromonadaceae bacterium]